MTRSESPSPSSEFGSHYSGTGTDTETGTGMSGQPLRLILTIRSVMSSFMFRSKLSV